jgi:transglutaminase-like putative cysteine protease
MSGWRCYSIFTLCAVAGLAQPRERKFRFEYRASVPSSVSGTVYRLWVPIPHDDPYQRIANLSIEAPSKYEVATAALGNRILSIESNRPPSITVKFDCSRKEHLRPVAGSGNAAPLSDADRARWLAPDRLVPIDDTIRKWAAEVVNAAHAKTDLEMARAIYDHVVATVKYDKTGKGWGRDDIYYACDARRGNCTDFHAIFIGYARAMGIPARFSIGFPLPSDRARVPSPAITAGRNFVLKASAGFPSTRPRLRKILRCANIFSGRMMRIESNSRAAAISCLNRANPANL